MAKQQTPYRMTALTDIKPYEHNPRIIPQAAVDAVARSIQAFGFRQPIVVDGNGVILAGHTRYRAAQQLGMTEVPVVWQTDITDIQARGYRIADNKVAELSAWDRDALDAEVRELADLGDIDIGAVGLADWELERILHESEPGERPQETPPSSYSQAVNRAVSADAVQIAPPHADDSASREVLLRIVFPDHEKLDAASPEIAEVVARFGGSVLGS
jgi:site-specific DNA-methyltransferase (adenine-specific)